MLVKKTIPEILDSIIKQDIEIEDNSICGKCSKCGECCTPYLPISQKELEIIVKYTVEKNIKSQKQLLVMENRLSCPYYNGKKCLIYEIRPLICREFYCYKKPDMKTSEKFIKDEYVPVDMWKVANEIDKILERNKNEISTIRTEYVQKQ